ncbi:MAG: ABC transporter ATP-binding protein, partial [Patescibacteria group bacterium]|nr:ABC transporter ATP-binding protein [Patescibacteria group bacterium]
SSGEAHVFGASIDTQSSLAKSYIGLVPQEFNFNIFEKVIDIVVNQAGYYGIPRKEALVAAEAVLKDLGLWEKRKETGQKLSGGMKRRLMIARALIHKPKLLILDEPTAGVDVELRRSMWTFLRKLNKEGTTIILTTHYLEEAEALCRNVAIINKGNIILNEPMQALLDRHGEKTLEDIYIQMTEQPPQTQL